MDINITPESSPSYVNPFSRRKMFAISFLSWGESTPQMRGSWKLQEMFFYLGKTNVKVANLRMACPTDSPCPASILLGTVNCRSQKPTIPKNGEPPKCPKMEVGGQVSRFIHFLSKYLLSACYVLGILLGSRFSGSFFFFEFVSVFQIFSHDPVSLLP